MPTLQATTSHVPTSEMSTTQMATVASASPFSAVALKAASLVPAGDRLSSGIAALDEFLGGGLSWGSVCEWGIPFGSGGREVLVSFLATISSTSTLTSNQGRVDQTAAPLPWTLWVQGRSGLTVYPPAWHARGVDLERIRFTTSAKPVSDLKPVFMDPLFKIIILDAPRSLSDDDCAFLARQARAHGQLIIILRDFFLGERRGNVWARLRINCWCPDPIHRPESLCLRVVRGLSQRQMTWQLPRLGYQGLF